MGLAAFEELVVGISHRLGSAAAEHDLEIHRFEAVIVEPVDYAGRAGDALPGPELAGEPVAGLILDEDGQIALQDEKDFLDLVRVGGITLARRAEDDAEGKGARRDRIRIVVLAGAAGANEAMLGAAIALDLGVLERFPIGYLVTKAADIAFRDLVKRQGGNVGRHRMAGGGHGILDFAERMTSIDHADMRRDDAPAFGKAHPALLLAPGTLFPSPAHFRHRRRQITP